MFEAYSPEKTADEVPAVLATDSSIRIPPQPISTGTEPMAIGEGRTTSDSELVAITPALAVPALDCRSKRHRLSSVGDCRTGREARGQRKNGKYSDTLSRRCGAARRVLGR